jgi:6-phospho-beta-glucosidase
MSLKVAVIGSGSSYTPELINGFLDRVSIFPLKDLWLMDISQERQEIVGKFAQRMVQAKGAPFNVHLTTNQREAVEGASYVITQLRVGGMEARRNDEYMGRRHGLVGQETTGIGGMAKAMRTIPVILNLAGDIQQVAPGALLVNFANPAGLVTEALVRHAPAVPAVGVCNSPMIKMDMLANLTERYGVTAKPEQVLLNVLGLNHLCWYRGLTVNGKEYWPQVLETYLEQARTGANPLFDPRTIEVLGMIPNGYLQYFYYTAYKVAAQDNWPPSRAEEVAEVEADLLGKYAEPERTEPPEELMKRGGKYYSTIATQLLTAHYNNLGETHVVNVRHNGAVPGWPQDWVLEMPCRVDKNGIQPLPAEPLPPECFGFLAAVKMYELLTVEAAVYGDRDAAYKALLVHPLGPEADKIQAVLDDMLETHRAYLPQFWGQ